MIPDLIMDIDEVSKMMNLANYSGETIIRLIWNWATCDLFCTIWNCFSLQIDRRFLKFRTCKCSLAGEVMRAAKTWEWAARGNQAKQVSKQATLEIENESHLQSNRYHGDMSVNKGNQYGKELSFNDCWPISDGWHTLPVYSLPLCSIICGGVHA